jgi:DNA invertase Pin-like site-specific DNA recombinase
MPFIPKEFNTMTQQDQTNHTVTQRGRAAIYARVAPGARTQSTQPQTATLIALANKHGFPNEQIIVYEDAYASRRKPLAGRGALSDLLTAIMQEGPEMEQEPIKAIYVSSEHRLFRDQDAVGLAHFITVYRSRRAAFDPYHNV